MCCRSALTRILDLEGHADEARLIEAIMAGPDETFEFESKVQDLAAIVADNLDVRPAQAPALATTILDVLDGPPDQWTFEAASRLVQTRTHHDISALAPLWPTILESAHA